jgi:hypothetical protein
MSERSSPHCENCGRGKLEALYSLNILAKEYAESASESYNNGFKQRAHIHSERKDALYSLKDSILKQFVAKGCVDTIAQHQIDEREYYCLYIGEFSFHSPVTHWDDPIEEASGSVTELDDFTADPATRSSELEEKDTLVRLSGAFESPNHHLQSAFTNDEYPRFIGWSYLPGAVEEGDKVPDHFLHDHNGEGDFIFEIGDRFQTGKGRCEIVDRYHAYLTPLYDRSPLLQQPAYDILVNGERKKCVTSRELTDEWHIIAHSIENPLPNVAGELGERAGNAVQKHVKANIEFSLGDILELQPPRESQEPIYCKLAEAHVSGTLLLGQYEPVPPSDDAPMSKSIEEIADDVIQVHETAPVAE